MGFPSWLEFFARGVVAGSGYTAARTIKVAILKMPPSHLGGQETWVRGPRASTSVAFCLFVERQAGALMQKPDVD